MRHRRTPWPVLQGRSRRSCRSPQAISVTTLERIRLVHRRLGLGVRRLRAYLRQAGLVTSVPRSTFVQGRAPEEPSASSRLRQRNIGP